MALAETARLVTQLSLDDKLTPGLSRAIGSVDAANSRIGGLSARMQAGLSQAGRGAGQLAVGLGRVAAVAGAAFVGGVGAAVKTAADFEAQLNTINTVVKASGTAFSGDLGRIGDQIRALSTKTGIATDELTGAYYDLVSAGISAADAQDVLTNSATLAIGGLATTKQTVDLLTTAINAYGGDASKAKVYTDELAQAINAGKVTADQIAASFSTAAPLAASLGVGVDQIAATYANMTAKGIDAEAAMTDMNSAMVALQRQTPELAKVIKSLGITNIDTEIRSKGLAATWDEIRTAGEKAGIPIIKLTGRIQGQQYVLNNTGDALAGYNKNLQDVRDSAGEAEAQMGERQKGLSYALNVLRANLKNVGITIGSEILPRLVPVVQKLSAFIQNNQAGIAAFGQQLADGIGHFLDRIDSGDFDGFVDALKVAAQISKGIVQAFLSLPSGIQGATIAFLGANKVSGGLLGKGLGNILGGARKIAIDLFKNRGASPANPLFVSDVTGGLGGGGGAIGAAEKAAGAGGLLGLLQKRLPLIGGLAGPLSRIPGVGGVLSAIPTLGGLAAIGGGAFLGANIGGFINENFQGVKAARTGEQSQFEGLVQRLERSGSREQITNAIGTITNALNPKDFASQMAIALDVGKVKTTLQDQLDVLNNVLDSYDQAHADYTAGEQKANSERARAAAAMAQLGVTSLAGSQGIRSAVQQGQAITQRGFRQQLDPLYTIARKRSSVTVNNHVSVGVTSVVNVNAMQTQLVALRQRTNAGTQFAGFI